MGRKQRETVNCECELTNEEKLRAGKELAARMGKVARLQERLAGFRGQIQAEIRVLNAEINALGQKLESGSEYRDVECVVHYNWGQKEKLLLHPKTGEIVSRDVIPEGELQEELEIASEHEWAEPVGEDGESVEVTGKGDDDAEGA